MKLHEWQNRFEPRILTRGENYYYDGAVRALKWNGHDMTATVSGTENYKVKIAVSDGIVGEMSCTCPYADENNCKHMAAVLFEASGDDFPGESRNYQKASGMSLEEAVQALSASDAKILLLCCAQEYPDIADRIRVKVTGGVGREQIRKRQRLMEEWSDKT